MPFSFFVTSRIALRGSRLILHLKPSAKVPKGIHLSTWHLELSRSVAFSSSCEFCVPNDSSLIPFLFIFLDHYSAIGLQVTVTCTLLRLLLHVTLQYFSFLISVKRQKMDYTSAYL